MDAEQLGHCMVLCRVRCFGKQTPSAQLPLDPLQLPSEKYGELALQLTPQDEAVGVFQHVLISVHASKLLKPTQ